MSNYSLSEKIKKTEMQLKAHRKLLLELNQTKKINEIL